jgi:hypothetical protein
VVHAAVPGADPIILWVRLGSACVELTVVEPIMLWVRLGSACVVLTVVGCACLGAPGSIRFRLPRSVTTELRYGAPIYSLAAPPPTSALAPPRPTPQNLRAQPL